MDINIIAKRLLETLAAPKGSVSVLPWQQGKEVCIRVFFDPDNRLIATKIPSKFEGITIKAETRKLSVPH